MEKKKENENSKTSKHLHEPKITDITSVNNVATNACYTNSISHTLSQKEIINNFLTTNRTHQDYLNYPINNYNPITMGLTNNNQHAKHSTYNQPKIEHMDDNTSHVAEIISMQDLDRNLTPTFSNRAHHLLCMD